jgi:Dopey, N-terminal
VYAFIFSHIGTPGISQDLNIYLPGIASTLTFASLSVRPTFLSLIEDHVLQAPTSALRPALKALILALLPGLEEETSEEFERTLRVVQRIKDTYVSDGIGEVFWQNLFLTSITSPGRRQGVLSYLDRALPKLDKARLGLDPHVQDNDPKHAEVLAIVTPEPGLMLRCFTSGLADEHALIQRGFLDLLVTHLPLHSSIFRQLVAAEDLELLVAAAVGVVSRRDMSLNRRLWSWFLGPEPAGEAATDLMPLTLNPSSDGDKQHDADTSTGSSYFQAYSVQPLTRALEKMVAREAQLPSEVSRPFRICLSLMDRWEIGSPVVEAIFLPLIRSLRSYQQNAKSQEDFVEVFRSANVFFDGVESILIWSKMLDLLVVPHKSATKYVMHNLELAAFVITNFNVSEDEMLTLYIPLVSLAMLQSLSQVEKIESDTADPSKDIDVQIRAFDLLKVMIEMIPDRVFLSTSRASGEVFRNEHGEPSDILEGIRSFFNDNQIIEQTPPPFSGAQVGIILLRTLHSMVLKHIHTDTEGRGLARRSELLSLLLQKVPSCHGFDGPSLVDAVREYLSIKAEIHVSFPWVFSVTKLVISLASRPHHGTVLSFDHLAAVLPELVRQLWANLSFSYSQHHIEAARLLQDLHNMVWREELVTSTVLSLMVGDESHVSSTPSEMAVERFATLWTHSSNYQKTTNTRSGTGPESTPNPSDDALFAFSTMLSNSLVLTLSVLHEPRTIAYATCREWLHSLANLSR